MAFFRLFFRFMVRPLKREPLRTALMSFAVALGVAVVVAIELAGTAAVGSFRSSLETLVGKADFEVTAVGGVPENILAQLATLPYPIHVTPRIEDYAVVEPSGETVPLLGLDLVAEAVEQRDVAEWAKESETLNEGNSVWVPSSFGLKPGETIRLILNDRAADYVVRGRSPDRPGSTEGERVVVIDIALAQQALGKQGRLDRILVTVPEHTDSANLTQWERTLRRHLPSAVSLERQGTRSHENRRMLEAFRRNLRILSYIALVVGAFLIYNTIAVSVVRRRAEIGILRALGATRNRILTLFLGEAAFFGLIGAVLGLALGRLMAAGAVRMLAATVESLYVTSRPAAIALTLDSVILALGVSLGIALISALSPAREAATVAPVEAMARGRSEYQLHVHKTRDLLLAALLAVAAAGACRVPPLDGKPLFGYVAALLLIAASALAIPAVVAGLMAVSSSWLRRVFGAEAHLAARSLAASLRRTSVLVGALSTAVAMMTSVGIMVGSFRQTVMLWLDNELRADLYLRPVGPGAVDQHPTMAPEIADRLAALPGVAAVDRFRAYSISYGGLPTTLGAGESRIIARFGHLGFLSGESQDVLARLPRGDYVIVSEPFASKHRLHAGDTIRLPLGGQARSFLVLGVYYDYGNERGFVIMDRATLLRYLPDPAPSNLAVFLDPRANPDQVRQSIDRVLAGHRVAIFTNGALRVEAMRIFDRTFAITYALEAVAIMVAVMGVAGALLALVIDRRRELGLLRFLGGSTGQIRRLILFEAGLLGFLSNLAGLALGILLSLILVYVINKQSFGWTIQFHWPVAVLLGALSVVYLATVLAGLYPARIGMRLNPIEVIREE